MALYAIQNLSFSYPTQDNTQENKALDGLDFTIEQGEFFLICGKSGCGKTTLLRHFKSALTPYGKREGAVIYDSLPLEKTDIRRQSAEIGYVLQSPEHQIVTDKVWHELAFGLENLGLPQEIMEQRVAEMAAYFGMEDWFYRSVEELSGGQKQLLNLASVMAMQPRVLILDEPTSQLDPIAAGEFLNTIRKINQELGTTIIMIEHRLEEVVPMADRVLVLENGKKLVCDTPRKVGKALAGKDLFAAMPTPMQIYQACGCRGECPLTIREGRQWLSEQYPSPGMKTCAQGQSTAIQSLQTIGKSITTEPPRELAHLPSRETEPILIAREVWFRYERETPDVLRGMSLQVQRATTFCILGGNGAGKSTTLSLLAGLRQPYRGKIKSLSSKTALLPQNPQTLFVKDTVMGDLEEMTKCPNNKERHQKMIKAVEETQIGHLLEMHPYDLSGGEQQRVALAKVLLTEPEILLLDEPTKGLDGFYKQQLGDIFARLKEQGTTIIMVSHDVEFCASYGDTCAMFFDGRIVTQRPAREFFQGNSFYTTAANRMSRHLFTDAITTKDVIDLCKKNS